MSEFQSNNVYLNELKEKTEDDNIKNVIPHDIRGYERNSANFIEQMQITSATIKLIESNIIKNNKTYDEIIKAQDKLQIKIGTLIDQKKKLGHQLEEELKQESETDNISQQIKEKYDELRGIEESIISDIETTWQNVIEVHHPPIGEISDECDQYQIKRQISIPGIEPICKEKDQGTPPKCIYAVIGKINAFFINHINFSLYAKYLTTTGSPKVGILVNTSAPAPAPVLKSKANASTFANAAPGIRYITNSSEIVSLDKLLTIYKWLPRELIGNDNDNRKGFTECINYLINTIIQMYYHYNSVSSSSSSSSNAAATTKLYNLLLELVMLLDVKSISDSIQYTALFYYGLLNTNLPITAYNPITDLPNDLFYNSKSKYDVKTNFDVATRLTKVIYDINKYIEVPNLVFVSSDKLACTVANLISNKQKICTRKTSSSGTVVVICQSRLFGIIAYLIGNTYETIIAKLFRNIKKTASGWVNSDTGNPLSENNQKILLLIEELNLCKIQIFNMLERKKKLENWLDEYIQENINKNLRYNYQSNGFNIPDTYPTKNIYADDETSCQNQESLLNYMTIMLYINNITNIIKTNLETIRYLMSQRHGELTCRTYGYSLAMTICKLLDPITFSTTSLDQQKIFGNRTFLASLYDMKGHDYAAISSINNIADFWLNQIKQTTATTATNVINIPNLDHHDHGDSIEAVAIIEDNIPDVPDTSTTPVEALEGVDNEVAQAKAKATAKEAKQDAHENKIIKNVMSITDSITIIQTSMNFNKQRFPIFKLQFDNNNNYLSANSTSLEGNETPIINICKCIGGISITKYAIDFTSGVQTFQFLKTFLNNIQKNTITDYKYRITYPQGIVDDYKERIAKNQEQTLEIELSNPTSEYDGAAPFNIIQNYNDGTYSITTTLIADKIIQIDTIDNNPQQLNATTGYINNRLKPFIYKQTPLSAALFIFDFEYTNRQIEQFDKIWLSNPLLISSKIKVDDIKSMLNRIVNDYPEVFEFPYHDDGYEYVIESEFDDKMYISFPSNFFRFNIDNMLIINSKSNTNIFKVTRKSNLTNIIQLDHESYTPQILSHAIKHLGYEENFKKHTGPALVQLMNNVFYNILIMLDNKEETQRQQGIKIFAQMLNITEIPSIYNEPIPFNKLDTNANFECVGDITLDTKYLSQDIFSFMNEWTYIQDKYRLAVRAWGIKSSKKNKTKKHKRFVRKSKNTQN